jgi:propanol-preferring alcohol dehydrogenase
MKALVLREVGAVEHHLLALQDVAIPAPGDDELLIKVHACGVCRTDLHVIEGELPLSRPGIIPGHQAVGTIIDKGKQANKLNSGDRVGVAWLHRTCGNCEYCRRGRENLCEKAAFTGYTAQGGYAEFVTAPEAFVYPIPSGFDDLSAAPLLCAGIIGFRCLRCANLSAGDALGIYGFGAAGHVCIQVARYFGLRVFVCTRDERHRLLAMELGAEWAGGTFDVPPRKLHAAIVFAPAGEIVPAALAALTRGGILILGGIHMTSIPSMEYQLLYHERRIQSVANNTRDDGIEFLKVAAAIPISTRVQTFPLTQANDALIKLKHDALAGAAVLTID